MTASTTINRKQSDQFKDILGATDPKLDHQLHHIIIKVIGHI